MSFFARILRIDSFRSFEFGLLVCVEARVSTGCVNTKAIAPGSACTLHLFEYIR